MKSNQNKGLLTAKTFFGKSCTEDLGKMDLMDFLEIFGGIINYNITKFENWVT